MSLFFGKIHFWITLLIAFFFPLSEQILPVLIILLFLAQLPVGKFRERISNIKHLNFLAVMIGFYAIHLIGLAYSANMNAGWFDIEMKASLLVLPVIYATSIKLTREQIVFIIYAYIVGCLLAAAYCLVGSITLDLSSTDRYINVYGATFSVFMHYGYFALYLNFAICCIIWLLYTGNRSLSGIRKLSLIALLLVFSTAVWFTSSKIGVLSMGMIYILCCAYLIIRYKKWMMGAATVLVLLGGSYLLVIYPSYSSNLSRFERILNIFDSKVDKASSESSTVRRFIWSASWDIIKENVLFGVGTGDVKDRLMEKYAQKGYEGAMKKRLNAHNQFLQSTISLGLIGLVLISACFVIPLRIAIRRKQLLLGWLLILYLIIGVTESVFEVQAGVIFFAFFSSLFVFSDDL